MKGLLLNSLQEMQRQIGRGTKLTPVSLTVIKKALEMLLTELNSSWELV